MANTVNSANMMFPVPQVGIDPGPTWASDLNSCLTIVDAHDHTVGNGVKITPNGMNISSDLPFANNSATGLLKTSFTSQVAALTGTNFLSFIGGNLYVNDSSGNQIPITSGGGVAGSPGSIGSLASPASATYSAGSKLFTWLASAGKSAAMDNGAVTIRETNVASAKGITLQSPTSLAADYNLTLLTGLPASTQYISCDTSGNLGTATPDTIGSAMTSTGANSIAAARTRATGTTVAAGGVAISSSSGAFSSAVNGTDTDITNLTVTITGSGRPIMLMIQSAQSASNLGYFYVQNTAGILSEATIVFLRDAVVINRADFFGGQFQTNAANLALPGSSFSYVDTPGAGTFVYKMQFKMIQGNTFQARSVALVAYEL